MIGKLGLQCGLRCLELEEDEFTIYKHDWERILRIFCRWEIDVHLLKMV